MKLIVGGMLLDKLIQDFVRRFPKLETKQGSFGKCKFMSYELALYLRRRGVKAKLLHCQTVAPKHMWLKTAHQTWQDKNRADWSHYVVAVGSTCIDLTARQFDAKGEHPKINSRADVGRDWETVETDSFMNNMVQEVLKAQTDANRSLREGQVKKTHINPARSLGEAPQQQQLRPSK